MAFASHRKIFGKRRVSPLFLNEDFRTDFMAFSKVLFVVRCRCRLAFSGWGNRRFRCAGNGIRMFRFDAERKEQAVGNDFCRKRFNNNASRTRKY